MTMPVSLGGRVCCGNAPRLLGGVLVEKVVDSLI